MLTRTALIALLAAAAAAILPATAMATVSSSLAITQGNGALAGSTTETALKATFTNKGTTPKAMQVTFPPGFLLNLGQNEGKCLASSAPSPSCPVGYVELTTPSEHTTWGKLYLVAPPTIGDVAGLALTLTNGASTLGTATVTLVATPAVELEVEFPPFPTMNHEENNNGGIDEAEIVLYNPRLPTACGAPLFFNLSASTFNGTTSSTNAPLTVSGCDTLPYAPKVAATVTKVAGEEADVTVTLTQPNAAGESATNGFEFSNPTDVKTNKVLAPCFKGTTCAVGTIVGSSPTIDSSELSTGELTLAGTITSGSLAAQINGAVTMSFPPPFQFAVPGQINTNEHTITYLNLPDLPLSSLTYTFLGVPAGTAFVTNCERATIGATLTPQDGGPPLKITGPVTNVGCPPPGLKPTASGSVSGLNKGKPRLRLHAAHGSAAAKLKSLSIGLPSGLRFSGRALASKKVCTGAGAHRRCGKKRFVNGLSLSGASVKRARFEDGKLVLVFVRPASSVSLTAHRPLLHESGSLEHKAKKHTTGNLVARLAVTDANGHTTALRFGVL
jgi:hypothetical protein